MKSVYVEKGCLWESLLKKLKQSEVQSSSHSSRAQRLLSLLGGSGKEVEVSCALGRGIHAMRLGAEDGAKNHIKAQIAKLIVNHSIHHPTEMPKYFSPS